MADQGAQIAGEVLAAIRLELNQRIIPALSDPDALHSAKMAEDILSHLSGWILFGRDISDEVVADFREMADETATTLGRNAAATPATSRRVSKASSRGPPTTIGSLAGE